MAKQQCAEQGCDEIALVEPKPGHRVCMTHSIRTEPLGPDEVPKPVPFAVEGWDDDG